MFDNIPQNNIEIKQSGQAVLCGTLEVLLSFLVSSPVLVMPLDRFQIIDQQAVRQWAVHVTAHPVSSGPVYYCTFRAAEVTHVGSSAMLTFPERHPLREDQAIERGAQLQQELVRCLSVLLRGSGRVSKVVTPACYRLPDVWVWSACSQHERLQFRENHWIVTR